MVVAAAVAVEEAAKVVVAVEGERAEAVGAVARAAGPAARVTNREAGGRTRHQSR